MKIGEDLISHLPSDLESKDTYEHHKRILELLKLGIYNFLPHLFILPKINKEYLINFHDYSRLFLSARKFSAGYYKESQELIKPISEGCGIAMYIQSQVAQKMGLFDEALRWLEKNSKFLNDINNQNQLIEKHHCCCSKGLEVLCYVTLLKVENYRALGVVYQRLEEKNKAEEYLDKAEKHLNFVKPTMDINDIRPYGVEINLYYSYGCYWLEQKNYDKAEALFERSINILEGNLAKICENWHAPYTRLSIVKLLLSKYESEEFFWKAKNICKDISSLKDREVSLDLAICTLVAETIKWIKPIAKFIEKTNTPLSENIVKSSESFNKSITQFGYDFFVIAQPPSLSG